MPRAGHNKKSANTKSAPSQSQTSGYCLMSLSSLTAVAVVLASYPGLVVTQVYHAALGASGARLSRLTPQPLPAAQQLRQDQEER